MNPEAIKDFEKRVKPGYNLLIENGKDIEGTVKSKPRYSKVIINPKGTNSRESVSLLDAIGYHIRPNKYQISKNF